MRALRWWMLLIAVVGLVIGWETGFFHSRVVDLEWEGDPVEFRVLALNFEGEFAVVDLEEGVMRLERLHHRGLPIRSVRVAAFTRMGDVLVNPSGERVVYVVPGDFSAAPEAIRPRRSVDPDADPADTGSFVEIDALGDQPGKSVWVLERTDVATLVDVITREGALLARFELDGSYFAGRLLGNDLVVFDFDGGDDLLLRSNGAIDEATTCPEDMENGDLRMVSAYGHHTACLSDDDRHLVLYDITTGQTDRFTAFDSGHWSRMVLPNIPSVNTRGVHSDQLLLTLQEPDPTNPPYTIAKAIYAADLSSHTMRWLYDNEEGESLRPLGIVDNLLIVSTGVIGRNEVIMSIDTRSGERQTIIELPEGYFIYDAA